jgi:hypothetical protein
MRREINDKLRAAYEQVKSTELSYPNRASILGLLGAALTVNDTTAGVLPRQLDAEYRTHMSDALKPLGFTLGRVSAHRGSRPARRKPAPHSPKSSRAA